MANAVGTVAITDGNGANVVGTAARSLILTFTTDASGNCVWPFIDTQGNPIYLNSALLGEQFTLGTATGFSAQLQIGIGSEDMFAGQGASIAGTTNKHAMVTGTDGTNTGVVFPCIVGQPTLSVSGGGNVKTGKIQLFLKNLG